MKEMKKGMRDRSDASGERPHASHAPQPATTSVPSCLRASVLKHPLTTNDYLLTAKRVFDIEIAGLKKTRDSLGPSFVAAAKLILSVLCDNGRVVVTGVGKNLHVAEKISGILSSTGAHSFVLNPVQAMHGDLGATSANDILLALSFSGESEELLKLIPAIRRHGLKVISMTGNGKSSLARLSDVHIAIPCGREACPFGMAPTTSTTATMAMGDALAMALLDARRFDIADYAANHPAGAIGKALLLTVRDVMRTGDHLALVAPTATVMDALMAMTKAQGGSAVVVGSGGKLLGIFTDGDFRRLMSEGRGMRDARGKRLKSLASPIPLSSPISKYMTRSPLSVRDNVPAADLVKIFEARRIDDLPVCDAKGRVVGLVDIQDLPKMKVI